MAFEDTTSTVIPFPVNITTSRFASLLDCDTTGLSVRYYRTLPCSKKAQRVLVRCHLLRQVCCVKAHELQPMTYVWEWIMRFFTLVGQPVANSNFKNLYTPPSPHIQCWGDASKMIFSDLLFELTSTLNLGEGGCEFLKLEFARGGSILGLLLDTQWSRTFPSFVQRAW